MESKMTDHISREALLERVSEVKDKLELDLNKPFDDGVRIGFENVEIEIENFPSADVREVKKGHAVLKEDGRAHCSECDWPINSRVWNFCPNCGADMREEQT